MMKKKTFFSYLCIFSVKETIDLHSPLSLSLSLSLSLCTLKDVFRYSMFEEEICFFSGIKSIIKQICTFYMLIFVFCLRLSRKIPYFLGIRVFCNKIKKNQEKSFSLWKGCQKNIYLKSFFKPTPTHNT